MQTYQRKQRSKALNLVNLRLAKDRRVRATAQYYFTLGLMLGLIVAGIAVGLIVGFGIVAGIVALVLRGG